MKSCPVAIGAALLLAALPGVAAAAPFDPEAATQAYLATLTGAARAKSDAYFEGGYWLILWGMVVAVLCDLAILHFGLSARMRDWAARRTKRRWLQPAFYALPYLLLSFVLSLPWTIYTGYFREKQYDLLSQSFGDWAIELAIALGVNTLIGMIAIMGVFALIRFSPKRWWLWGTGGSVAFLAVIVMISPVFLAPLFNTYTELKPGPVRDRIVAMAKANNVPADHIYVFDASRQSKRISANVSGLGPTIRISLNDNLLNRTSLPEIANVMGHELGHYVLGHVAITITVFSAIIVVVFLALYWLTPRLIARYGERWGVRGVDDPAVLPVFGMIAAVLFFLMTPVTKNLIRINESQADAFGLEAAREPDGMARTAMMLSEYRKIDPHPIEEILFFDHPSGATRIRMAMQWKAKHLAEIEARDQARAAPSAAAR